MAFIMETIEPHQIVKSRRQVKFYFLPFLIIRRVLLAFILSHDHVVLYEGEDSIVEDTKIFSFGILLIFKPNLS